MLMSVSCLKLTSSAGLAMSVDYIWAVDFKNVIR